MTASATLATNLAALPSDLARWVAAAPDAAPELPPSSSGDVPHHEVEQMAGGHKQSVTVLVGVGPGDELARLVGRMEEGHQVLVVEPAAPRLRRVLSQNDLSTHFRSGALRLARDPEESDQAIERLESSKVVEEWSLIVEGARPEITPLAEHVAATLHEVRVSVEAAVSDVAAEIARNEYATLPWIACSRGVRELFGRFAGRPAIVVATGPSLGRNIHLLKEAQGRAVVVAVAQALRPLAGYDVRPDFLCSVDYGASNLGTLTGLLDEDVPLVTINKTHGPLLRAYRGPKFVCDDEDALHGLLRDKGRLEQGGSVAHCAFSLAEKMGCDPILLVGLDLALGERSHFTQADDVAGITVEDGEIKSGGTSLGLARWVPGWFGDTVLTSAGLFTFHLQLQRMIAACPARVIDCTEGGARKPGTVRMFLADALAAHCREPVDKSALAPLVGPAPDGDALVGRALPVLDEDLRQLGLIVEAADQALAVAARVRKVKEPAKLARLLQESGRLTAEAQAAADHVPAVAFAAYEAGRRIASRAMSGGETSGRLLLQPSHRKELLRRVERNELILGAVRDAAAVLAPVCRETVERLRAWQGGDAHALDPTGDLGEPDLEGAEGDLAAGSFARALLEARRALGRGDPAERARRIEQEALAQRAQAVAAAERLQADERAAGRHMVGRYLDICDEARAHATGGADRAGALALLDEAKALLPARPEARWGRATILRDVGRLAESLDEYRALVRDFPDDPRFRDEVAQLEALAAPAEG
jgi:hypothetical protein